MAKRFTVEGVLVEENDFYKVIKADRDGKFYIFSKNLKKYPEDFKDSHYTADNYKIIGPAILQDDRGYKNYWNLINWQPFGQGRNMCYVMKIDSWKTKIVDGKEQTIVKYFDEKGYKYIRYVDEDGNLYKKQKKQVKQLQNSDDLSV